ncbi:MAG TPA: cytochrome ubiquinol oxidase subunit I [Porphyromonadaceae bacterium]|nr:cytochrome ubiquinol oxidase subunit I [Porphyromonadaceae bacterium]
MNETINASLVDWSRAQFALTALYHWIFVPLTLGLAVIMGIMETFYYKTGNEFWKQTAKFWMKLFGINFAIGVATGIILEFQFGTNWSNYSWFVGDIFGAPLAIEAILAFFMEATFIAVMFFGWNKVSKGFHLASTWLTGLGATISAWWILVANAWMQHPVGMEFNPATSRNEMVDFFEVAFSPVAVVKFFHTVLNGWVVGAVFVVGVSCWFLIKKRNQQFAISSIKIAAIFGLFATISIALTGDHAGVITGRTQPMKLAAMEGYYEGKTGPGLVAFGIMNPEKKSYDDNVDPFLFKIEIPQLLSLLAERRLNAYVPGINNIIDGGYEQPNGKIALSAADKMDKGQTAISAFDAYRKGMASKNTQAMDSALNVLNSNIDYFGYGYIENPGELVPNVPLVFYMFRVMVYLGLYFILLFVVVIILVFKKDLAKIRWVQYVALFTVPFAYIAGMAGWVVAECGRQPWAIYDLLPTTAAISKLSTSSVQITFFIFLVLFTVMLIAGVRIMLNAIKKGPEATDSNGDY